MRPARLLTALTVTTATLLVGGCGLIPTSSSTPTAAPSATTSSTASPTETPTASATESPAPPATETPGTTDLVVGSDRWFPVPVPPSLSTLWSSYKDKHTGIRFKLPSKPKSHTYKNSQGYGDLVTDWQYSTTYQLDSGNDPVYMIVDPYRITGALYASGSQSVQTAASKMRSNGYQRVSVSSTHTGKVDGHKVYFATISGYSPKDKKWTYARVAVIIGSGWGLYLRTDVWAHKVTQGDKSDTQKLMDAVTEGLTLPKGGS